jgi:bifunctional non-homologous end joining protein LigD
MVARGAGKDAAVVDAHQVPHDWRPMLATLADAPPLAADWSYEIKWDGIRALVGVDGGTVTITSRLGNDLSGRYPELAGVAAALDRPVLLDGEIVAFDDAGRPSFETLQQRMHVADARRQAQFAAEVPVALMVFDVLWHAGGPLLDATYLDRRAVLATLELNGPNWQTPASVRGADDGAAMLAASQELGLEGIVAKRSTSRYEPGRRSRQWLKVKHRKRQELVVGGWVEGQGSRRGTVGALLVGFFDDDGELRFAGRVGSGFRDRDLALWTTLLADRAVESSPFVGGPIPREAHFVAPELVVEVAFTEWTGDGRLRHPVMLGRRDDVEARSVRREAAPGHTGASSSSKRER